MPRIFAAVSVLLLTACVTVAEREASKKQWPEGVIVALNMCAQNGSFQHSKDPEGERVYCSREILVGTHIPTCVCRDEKQVVEERRESQQFMRNAAVTRDNRPGN